MPDDKVLLSDEEMWHFVLNDYFILNKEVWERPVTKVAKIYGVSDVAIHKICKSLDVPTPPNGYWAKVYTGKPVN